MTSIDIKKCLKEDGEALYCASLSSEFKQSLKTSVILEDKGKNGSNITWTSSDEKVINAFGRVTRPKSGEPDAAVTLTAKLELEGNTEIIEFEFCVVADEFFEDPCYISDEEFFCGNEDSMGYIDCDIPGLDVVRDMAQSGDFEGAKAELLNYFRTHLRHPALGERKEPGMIEMMTGGMQCLQRSDRLYKGKVTAGSVDFERKSVSICKNEVKSGSTLSLAVVSRFNEWCGLYIASKDADKASRPLLRLKTDAGEFEIECCDDVVLCPKGRVEKENNSLYIKNYGDFLGDETYVSALKFELTAPVDKFNIDEIILDISVRKDTGLEGEKEAYIVLLAQNTWNGETAKWSDFLWQFANRTGIAEKDKFDVEEGFDFEYFFQRVRFMYFNWAVNEYLASGNEDIPYALIRTMSNFIEAQGDKKTYFKNWHIGMGWYNDEVNQSLCAGWPRALDAAGRLSVFAQSLAYLTETRFMTPEIFTCALKYIRDGIYSIIYKSTTIPKSNLRMFELMGALKALSVYPEFSESKKFFDDAVQIIKDLMMTVTFSDGTYMEATGGYSNGVCLSFVEFVKLCHDNGAKLSGEFLERFRKFAIYNVLTQGPDGESIQYGDQGSQKNDGWQYPELMDIYKDDELNFILTRGDKGKMPEWKSYRFPESSATVLRDSWEKNATYIWTQARGGGSHGHQDDHHITLIAENRVLLTDAGIFTYSAEDPYRIWGTSPKAHNTVIIDGKEQVRGSGIATLEEFITSDEKDIVSQTSHAYPGFEFTRRIEWLKNKDVIYIEDTLCPDDSESVNTFRQAWHLNPTAKISFDSENKTIMSNYTDGVNIKITSLDDETHLKNEEGWYDYGYQQLTDNPYGSFVKENQKGKVVFKTKIQILKNFFRKDEENEENR